MSKARDNLFFPPPMFQISEDNKQLDTLPTDWKLLLSIHGHITHPHAVYAAAIQSSWTSSALDLVLMICSLERYLC